VLGAEEDSADQWLAQARCVPGWLTDAEARQRYRLAHGVALAGTPVAVEIGSWQGKSSVMIAGGLAASPGAQLHCIDPFGIDKNPEYQRLYYTPLLENMDRTLEQAFKEHMLQSGLSSAARPVRGYSFEIVRTWTAPIDFLFIDANHEYE
jgi:methyltransferase family protein